MKTYIFPMFYYDTMLVHFSPVCASHRRASACREPKFLSPSQMVKKQWFYCVFAWKCWTTIGYIILWYRSKLKKTMVLLCFGTKMLKNQWFYGVFIQKHKKAPIVLCCRSKSVKKHWVHCVFAQTNWKKHWFYFVFAWTCWKIIGLTIKPAPMLEPRFRSNGFGSRIWHTRSWKENEEPKQASCLGNKTNQTLAFDFPRSI